MSTKICARRHDTVLAQSVQSGISLLHIAGAAEARRYLEREGVSEVIIKRILKDEPLKRRAVDPIRRVWLSQQSL